MSFYTILLVRKCVLWKFLFLRIIPVVWTLRARFTKWFLLFFLRNEAKYLNEGKLFFFPPPSSMWQTFYFFEVGEWSWCIRSCCPSWDSWPLSFMVCILELTYCKSWPSGSGIKKKKIETWVALMKCIKRSVTFRLCCKKKKEKYSHFIGISIVEKRILKKISFA